MGNPIGPKTAELLIASLAAGHVPDEAALDERHGVRFILRLARALHTCGLPAHRLEAVLEGACQQLGLKGQFASTPTTITAGFGAEDEQRTYLLRVEPAGTNLDRLSGIDRVAVEVLRGTVRPSAGAERIEQLLAARGPYGDSLTALAFGVSSAAGAVILGGGLTEALVAGVIGLVIGVLAILLGGRRTTDLVFEPVAATVAAVLAVAASHLVRPFAVPTAILAGVIVLLPGYTMTLALTELASRHLTSGTARASSAVMTFLSIAFGVALGGAAAAQFFGEPLVRNAIPLPDWTLPLAVLLASLAFVVVLKVGPRDAGWVVLAGLIAVGGSRLGAHLLGAEVGSFAGAMAVGVASNLFARLRDRPSLIMQVPGIILLVPGSIGFRSVTSLLDYEVVTGLETAVRMILIAISLV
ncbi:MAG: threonine/serine ThrE exporter family protein, partial [Gemmatimonadota bacterium]